MLKKTDFTLIHYFALKYKCIQKLLNISVKNWHILYKVLEADSSVIYSAYYDNRDKPTVRVIAATKTKKSNKVNTK